MIQAELTQFPLFEGIPDHEVEWLVSHSHEETLKNGAYFHHEGKVVEKYYIVLDGELQVTKKINGKETVMGTTPPGIMGGELSLLTGNPSEVAIRAIMPCRLLVLDQNEFRQIFAACPTLGARIFRVAADRTHEIASVTLQQEKMAALGKLSAGLAHELNNPAAAASRAAHSLAEALPSLVSDTMQLNRLGLADWQLERLLSFQKDSLANGISAQPIDPLAQSNREEEIAGWLETMDIGNVSELGATFASWGINLDELKALANQFHPENVAVTLTWMCTALYTDGLLQEIEQSSSRISDLVGAIKEYTYRDQSQVQLVDIHKGLENTLMVMRYKLRNTRVVREYDPNLPQILGRGGELNQVWTNLIDNAVDAMPEDGELRVITRGENDYVMVEISDNGKGIPAEALPHLFEPFFTTKAVGAGTGLGLDISYRIIQQHNGTVEVQSQPGRTRFIVRLPLGKAASKEAPPANND